MNGRRDYSEEPARGGLGLRRPLVVYYVATGAVLAILRIALIAWGNHNHGKFFQWHLYWVFYPEELLYGHTDFHPTGLIRMTTLFVVGSYVIVSPVLAAGWLLHRPRLGRQVVVNYLSCGAALAIARIVVLVLAHDKAQWSIPWVLYPEALLLIHTPLGYLGWDDSSFVFATLLAAGSYVMTIPILLVGWLSRRRR
jgi:hypothetical protein